MAAGNHHPDDAPDRRRSSIPEGSRWLFEDAVTYGSHRTRPSASSPGGLVGLSLWFRPNHAVPQLKPRLGTG